MDKQEDSTGILSDEEIFDQLRQYADALAARARDTEHRPVEVLDTRGRQDTSRRMPMLAVAAAIVALVGAAAFFGLRDENSSIQSTSDDQTTTTTANSATTDDVDQDFDSGAFEDAGSPLLLANSNRWVITEAYPTQTSAGGDSGGAWAWRLDEQLFVLVDGFSGDDLGPRNQAKVEVGDGRLMLGWLDGEHQLGLQGYGVDEATIRAAADAIRPAGDGWTLPGAEVVIAQAGGNSSPTESIQVGYSPLTADGIADLSTVVQGIRRQGTEADLYRELFDASSLGQVTETVIVDQPGYLISGQFGSYGLVYSDGWVFSWQTLRPDVDLADLLSSTQPATAQEWDAAVAGADDNVAAAINAVVSAGDGEAELAGPEDDPQLPRYLMPEPWNFEWVTDMGLWSAEERTQREALNAAHEPPGGFADLILTQGFVQSGATAGQPGSLPFAMPELLVRVFAQGAASVPVPEGPEQEAFSFAGLDGYLEEIRIVDPTAETGFRTRIQISVGQDDLRLVIEAPFGDEETVRRFVDGLSIPDGDLANGVETTDGGFEQLLELPGDLGNGAGFFSRWLAAYTTSDGQGRAVLSVDSLTFEQLQIELMREASRGANFGPVAEGRYLANRYERSESVTIDEDGTVRNDGPVTVGTTVMRYDSNRQILISLDIDEDVETTIALMDLLTEVDIDTWRELVEPFNSKPQEPR